MPTTYTETPDNFNEIGTFVEKEINGIKKIFYLAQRVIFYELLYHTWNSGIYHEMYFDGACIRQA